MNSSQISKAENLKTDIVVIGGGGTGLAAAVAAVENGAKVIVLEKRRTPGGNSVFPGGLFAAESPVQKRMMIDARKDDLFKIAMDYSHYKINPRIIRAFIDKSGDTIRWLEEKGVKFDSVPHLYPNQVPRTWHCPKGGGATIVKALVKNCEKLGIRLLCNTAAKKILTGQAGEVTGVLATLDGKEIKITARSVIIGTGGYGGNQELMNKYCPTYAKDAHLHGLPHMGDGLLMATEAGAATEDLGIVHVAGLFYPWSKYIWPVVQEPNSIWVNKRGERFIDETVGFNHFVSANPVYRQPDKISYTVLDARMIQNILKKGFVKGLGLTYVPGFRMPDLDKKLQVEAGKGRVRISDSWDEIARWIGADPAVLKATIDEYNSCCDRGYDKIFNKEPRYLEALSTPPYYAIKSCLRLISTIGGIKINHNMEVLDNQDKPIPGLYAGGVDAGGWETDTYNVILSGKAFGFAINSGRIAGENAAKSESH